VITWSVSQCYAFECDRSFYCALFCVFMTHVSCAISLRAEHPLESLPKSDWRVRSQVKHRVIRIINYM
jgi:hypothetical protein